MERGILHGWNKVWIKKKFLSMNLSKFGTNFPYILPGSLPIMTQLPSIPPASFRLSLFLLSSSAPNILTGQLNERDLCWRWGWSPRWLSESSQGPVQVEKPWREVLDRCGPRHSTVRKEGRMGKWLMLEGAITPTVFMHRTQAAPAPKGLHFCSVPPKEGVFHILSFTLVV